MISALLQGNSQPQAKNNLKNDNVDVDIFLRNTFRENLVVAYLELKGLPSLAQKIHNISASK